MQSKLDEFHNIAKRIVQTDALLKQYAVLEQEKLDIEKDLSSKLKYVVALCFVGE